MTKALRWIAFGIPIMIGGRCLIIWIHRIEEPAWITFLLWLFISSLALIEIAWSRSRFQKLEQVICSFIRQPEKAVVHRWYLRSVDQMYNLRKSAVTGSLFSLLVAGILWYTQWNSWEDDALLRWYDNIVIICVMSMAAASQWPFANISIFVSRLARKNLSINFYAHHHDNLMSVGSFLMKIDLGGVLLTFLVGLNLYLAPTLIPMTVYIVLLIVFIWAIIWFFLTQYNVHLCMMNEKRDKLNTISKRMMVALEILLKEPDEVNMATFDRMKKTFDEVAVLPEWPFNTQNLVTLLTGIIVPITLTLLQLLMVKK